MTEEEELPHLVVDPWHPVGHKIDPPYGLIVTAISDIQGWLRNAPEQTNTDDAGAYFKELVIPANQVLALIDKLKEISETYLDEQKEDTDSFNEALHEANLQRLGTEKKLMRARRRIVELRIINKGLRLAIRNMAKSPGLSLWP
jgi:CRISPR/Cas system CMR subunit Cmr4 (Cas7 group RAMP superfamily)